MQDLSDEERRRAIEGHIDQALREVHGGWQWASRGEFVNEIQRRVTRDLRPGFPVRDRIDEILDTFMSRDDSP